MSFDGIVTKAVVSDCQTLVGGRIVKITQPFGTEVILQIRHHGRTHQLLLSAHPVYSRVHLLDSKITASDHPPAFCMLLRKQLEGGIIDSITQISFDRIIHIIIKKNNDLGDREQKTLIIEIMGRHSNIVLINTDDIVMDGIRRVYPSISRYRQIFPGSQYVSPPGQERINPLKIDQTTFDKLIMEDESDIDQCLMKNLLGIGPLITKEIQHLNKEISSWNSFRKIFAAVESNNYKPNIIHSAKTLFHALPLTHLAGIKKEFSSISKCLEEFFQHKMEADQVKNRAGNLIKKLKNELEKCFHKLAALEAENQESLQAEQYKIFGELLMANLHDIKAGTKIAKIPNFYTPEQKIETIPLDPSCNPKENARKYFKKYGKLKRRTSWNENQLDKTTADIRYLEGVLILLENASLKDIHGIEQELSEEGYLQRPQSKKESKKKQSAVSPTRAFASDGSLILIGKNNKQNEYLTQHIAAKTDIWLHTKDIPGSHVVIRGKEISSQSLHEAAIIAAYFSKARSSAQVPVDYTLIKHVKKPSGSRPGFVIYDKQQTIYVTPCTETVQKLLNNEQ